MKMPVTFSSLRFVLVLQVALPVLLLLGIILAVGLTLVGQFVEDRLQRDLKLVARTIHLPVSQALERQDLEQLQNSMTSVFAITEVYGAYLFDDKGQQLSSFGVVNPTRRQAAEALEMMGEGEFAKYERIRGRQVYSFFMPLFDEAGQPSGLLQVTRRRRDIEDELSQLQRWTWGGFILMSVLIMGILMLTHQRAIGEPLNRLLSSIRRVSGGERKHRTNPQGPLEVKQLATGLNGMLDAIESAEVSENAQRQAREEMAERLRRAETMAALGQLSAGVAHELGAPLTVVDGRASRLLRRSERQQDHQELNDIRHQVTRMTAIIEQLLNFGRSSRAKKRPLDVGALVARSMALIEGHSDRIRLVSGPQASIHGDPLSLEQALVNLLRNACQACPEGAVEIRWQRESGHVLIYVDDAGPGVEDAMRGQLFEPFVTSKKPGEGSGLGLAIVHRVMQEHGGDVQCADSPLGGAQFCLRFTLGVDADGVKP
ncbi:HAMP domain-containing protein [Marinomonas sp. M1K-6]|uniref:histidine kinase n=1 Tax=Marinomonas profundi TaxID=2726122 RepID=A0A847R3K2_9GAMM|nr:ATP-binding protein [Marinomonas profundi]NLQ18521.1 HAMP domain-containing protein [Marinomonas profundi]UDV04394.1 ATP-binding protein [Marinomonas profundi]